MTEANGTTARGLIIEGVSKSFGPARVLDNVHLSVGSSEFVTLLGPSGCGKTTLLRIVAGLELADAGCVRLDGADITHLAAHQRPVNTVFQNYALFPHLNIFENIAFGLRSRHIGESEITLRVAKSVDLVQLGGFEKRMPHQLSGGQKQRVALARALVNEPKVLLLDEPMSALDARLRAEVQIELRRIQRALGTTFVLVTHDQEEAMTVSDRLMVMNGGRIVQSGGPEEVYERPNTRFVAQFLGAANLISGRYDSSDGKFRCALGEFHVVASPAWSEGTLAIRPERIRVRSEQPATNGIRARVREVIVRGGYRDLFVEPGDLRVRVSASELTGAPLNQGDEIWIELRADDLRPLED